MKELRVRAPGRANLIGEHTDHTDGLVLPVAIDRAVTCTASVGGDRIRLHSLPAGGEVDVAADGSESPAGGWGRYVAAVAAELAALGRPPVGIKGSLESDLPQGAGLSSSAALEVAVGLALVAAADFELDPLVLAAACRRAERRAVGVPSGILDQAACLLGRAGHAVLLDCADLRHRPVPLLPDHALIIIDSGVRRELASSGYGQRSRELAGALPVLDGRRPADVDPSEVPELIASLPPVPARRLRHVVTENARVREAVAAFEARDETTIAASFAASHASLRDDYEVSIHALDLLVELAMSAGATAARLTGGGFGGSVVALVPSGRVGSVTEAVADGAAARLPDPVTLHRCVAGDGAVVEVR
ncbi:galactokinase [Nitriliruptoraceae bacterium ZYF776]|nr:galactokinase [Profundirhabdus halotolerans]